MTLYDQLFGSAPPYAPRPKRESERGRVVCECGGVIALLYSDRYGLSAWLSGYRHTKVGTAEVIKQAALDDSEHIVERHQQGKTVDERFDRDMFEAVLAVLDLETQTMAAQVERLQIPPRTRLVSGLAKRWDEIAAEAASTGHKPGELANMDAGCPNCRAVGHVGRGLVEIDRAGRHAPKTVVAERSSWNVATFSYQWPPEGAATRASLYQSLCALCI